MAVIRAWWQLLTARRRLRRHVKANGLYLERTVDDLALQAGVSRAKAAALIERAMAAEAEPLNVQVVQGRTLGDDMPPRTFDDPRWPR